MPTVCDHAEQIRRAADDLEDIESRSLDFGKVHVLHILFLIIETALFAGATYEALYGSPLAVGLALGGFIMVGLHVMTKVFEHRRYERYRLRIRQRVQEMRRKADEQAKAGSGLGVLVWWNPWSWFR